MRTTLPSQLQLGESDIAAIQFDVRSRDDIPQILQGLQYIYVTPELRDSVFSILEGLVLEGVSSERGRPGMDLWKAFVLSTLRVNLNMDYDRLHELSNQHRTLRRLLGHGLLDDDAEYKLQTIKDNAALVDEESLEQINQLVVDAGHKLLKKKRSR